MSQRDNRRTNSIRRDALSQKTFTKERTANIVDRSKDLQSKAKKYYQNIEPKWLRDSLTRVLAYSAAAKRMEYRLEYIRLNVLQCEMMSGLVFRQSDHKFSEIYRNKIAKNWESYAAAIVDKYTNQHEDLQSLGRDILLFAAGQLNVNIKYFKLKPRLDMLISTLDHTDELKAFVASNFRDLIQFRNIASHQSISDSSYAWKLSKINGDNQPPKFKSEQDAVRCAVELRETCLRAMENIISEYRNRPSRERQRRVGQRQATHTMAEQ